MIALYTYCLEIFTQLDILLHKSIQADFKWLPRPVVHYSFISLTCFLVFQAVSLYRGLSLIHTLTELFCSQRYRSGLKWSNTGHGRLRSCAMKWIRLCSRNNHSRFQKSLLWLHKKTEEKKDTNRQCNLLPTEGDVCNVKAVITVIMEILGMNCRIPHYLWRRDKVLDLTSGEYWCILTNNFL